MPSKTERNLRLALAYLKAALRYAQSAVLLMAFGTLLAIAIWPQFGGLSLVLAVLAMAIIVGLAQLLPPAATMRLYGGRRPEPGELTDVQKLVSELAGRAALPRTPELYVIPSSLLSAFSMGSGDRSAIAVTEGLLRRLTMRETAAVVSGEVAQIGMGDLFLFAVADFVTRFAQALYYAGLALVAVNVWRLITHEDFVSWWTVALFILAPTLINLLQTAMPRASAFAADRAAAFVTGDPLGLASAISRIEMPRGQVWDDLLPPVPARKVPLPSLLRCPPPAGQRIARLKALDVPPMPPLDVQEGPRISLVGVGPIEMRPRYRWPGVWF
jgi:heat shock protein HtpX